MQGIPKKIHQMWLDKKSLDASPPAKYQTDKFINGVKTKNPEFEYKLWNRQMIEQLFDNNEDLIGKYRHFYYHGLQRHIERCDFGRYLVLYIEGGFYVDLDCEAKRSFAPLAARDFACIRDWHDIGFYTKDPQIFNGFLACTPKHFFMRDLLDCILYRYKNGNNVFDTTGPAVLGLLAAKKGLLVPSPDGWRENWNGFIDPCLIMPNSELHNNRACEMKNAANPQNPPYVEFHWKEGTGWGFEWENLKELFPQALEKWHRIIMFLMLLVIVVLVGITYWLCTRAYAHSAPVVVKYE